MLKHNAGISFLLSPNWKSWSRPTVVCRSSINSSDYHVIGAKRLEKNYVAFQYTLSGSGIFFDGRENHKMSSGKGFLVNITDPVYQYYYPSENSDVWDVLCICGEGEQLIEQVREINQEIGYVFEIPPSDEIISRILGYCSENFPSAVISPVEANNLVNSLLGRLIDCANEMGSASSNLAIQLHKYMIENLNRPFSLSDVAKQMLISREHLARVFCRYYGEPPVRYLLRIRCERTRFLLLNSHLTLKEIADNLGFYNSSALIKAFKDHFGVTPNSLRKNAIISQFQH